MKPAIRLGLAAARREGRPVALVTDLAAGAQALVFEDEVAGDLALSDEALARARALLTEGASGPADADGALFARVYAAPWRLVLVGAVHIAQHLAHMAEACGYAVAVVDPRAAFVTEERFSGHMLARRWADEYLAEAPIDRRTGIVALAHDPKLDDPALAAALRSDAFYVGALGSRRTHAKRVERLLEAGFSEAEIARVRAPIGLDLGGRSPAEIAVSILAEVIQARYGKA